MKRPSFRSTTTTSPATGFAIEPGVDICQSDLPLDWYQQEFVPYAQEYLALPDRTPETVLPWMRSYLDPARAELGDDLLLLAHFYMGGEIVQLVELFGGSVADSYQLALMAREHPRARHIVESAVHFMAETIAILAHDHQRTYITNPKSGCTMEMFAKGDMVEPALDGLNERYGAEQVLPVCYMNTSGRVKALTGAQGGAVCTSSNVEAIFRWARAQGRRIFFVPDRHLGENAACLLGIEDRRIVHWPGGDESRQFAIEELPADERARFDEAELILFGSHCGVHTVFTPAMAEEARGRGYTVLVHPECPREVVAAADGAGSTAYLWRSVLDDDFHGARYAVATESHFVTNLRRAGASRGIEVAHLAAFRGGSPAGAGCGCATMSRNDPPHLVALVDLLRRGAVPDLNEVRPGDVVDERNGRRERLDDEGQRWVVTHARSALERMIEITSGREPRRESS